MSIDEVSLGRGLQNARKKAGLTQQQLCQKAGLSYSTLAKIERGAIKSPSIFTIQSIASALGVSLSELMGEPTNSASSLKKRSKSGIRFIYFDINGCLVRFFHRAFTRLAEDTGAPADVIESTFWHNNDAVCRGKMSVDEFDKAFAERLGIKTIDWQAYYLDAVDAIDEMQPLVAWAAENYHVGLLSNIMPGFISALFAREKLPNVSYTVIVDSSEVGAIKPEPEIYEIAQKKAGVPADEILLVDDSRANLMAAEKMGWHVLWFDDYRVGESTDRVRSALELED
ncbi:MAG TPA: HAD-IA family hydrolase [Candidatus Saccharimonadales bacterium]|nr:HAD-IA family hydrolase [Candidatus Saccharimonadales bacterium]